MSETFGASAPVPVVGAGLAGLTAAYALARAGVETVVLEARERVGGRAWTVTDGLADGQHCDLGGELITADYRMLPALCEEVGVQLSEENWIERPDTRPDETPLEGYLADGRIVVGGELLTGPRFAAVDREIRTALRQTPPAAQEPSEQWMRRAGLSADARGAVTAVGRMPVQYDQFQVDTHYLTEAHVGAPRRIVGGTQRLADALARDLDVRLETPVRTIRQAGGRVQVDLEDDERLIASQAVVAVPAFVLPTIGFDPPLPAALLHALTSLQRSSGGKVVAQYAEGDAVRRALGHTVFTDGPVNTAWVSNPYVTTGPAVVSGFVCGTDRPVLESEERAAAALDAVVAAAVGGPVTRIAGMAKNWTADPYALGLGGTASYPVRGGLVALFATPERRVHFAGSYTDVDLPETLEGAVRSGYRVAGEVLRFPDRMNLAEIESRMVRG